MKKKEAEQHTYIENHTGGVGFRSERADTTLYIPYYSYEKEREREKAQKQQQGQLNLTVYIV